MARKISFASAATFLSVPRAEDREAMPSLAAFFLFFFAMREAAKEWGERGDKLRGTLTYFGIIISSMICAVLDYAVASVLRSK